jgi:hypothetical protein
MASNLVQKLIALKFKQKVLIFRKICTPKFLGCYRTGGSFVCPCGSVNCIDELRVALMPPRRRVLFLLGGAMSSSIL